MSFPGCWVRLFFHSFFFIVCFSLGIPASVRQRFSCLSVVLFCRTVCRYMRLSFFFSTFGSFALASGLRCLPCGSLLGSTFSRWFSILCLISSSVLSPLSRNIIPLLVCANCFRLLLPCFLVIDFLFFSVPFVFISLAFYLFIYFLFFNEWEHRTVTMCPFSTLHPSRKRKERQ